MTDKKDAGPQLREQYQDTKTNWWMGTVAAGVIGAVIFTGAVARFQRFGWSDETGIMLSGLGVITIILIGWSEMHAIRAIIRWDCAHCGKRLESNVPWVCGSCDRENWSLQFLKRCKYCKAIPKAFECYHCGKSTFFFADDVDERTRARRVPKPRPGETEEQTRLREIAEREHQKQKLELDVELAKLQRQLNPSTEKPDLGQERMKRLWRDIENAGIDVKTIQQTVVKEKQLHAEIDSNPDLDQAQKDQIKQIVSRKFENLRIDLGGDIRV